MPRLVLINGAPGTGKSMLARRWADEHPLTVALDIDVLRGMVGGWRAHPAEAGVLARRSALAVIRTAITAGHDVLVPQLLARPEFLVDLETEARLLGVEFVHVVLTASTQTCVRRVRSRAARSPEDVQLADPSEDLEAVVTRYATAIAGMATGAAVVIDNDRDDDGEAAFADLVTGISARDGAAAQPRAAAAYVRFESLVPRPSGRHPGLFALLRGLRESGRLSAADADRASRLVDRSYEVHAEPAAEHFDTEPRALSWFRTGAPAAVWDLADDVRALLDSYGIGIREVRCTDPGRVTYADDIQVVAVPHTSG